MSIAEFHDSLQRSDPPLDVSPVLVALWYDAKGNWHMSHSMAQDIDGPDGARVHAYLHRKEGDIWNADYWYRQAGEKRPDMSLEKEFELLLNRFMTP